MSWRDELRAERTANEQIRQDRADREAVRRRQDEAHAEHLAAGRRAERAERRASRRAALPELGMAALWATLIVLPICLAWAAQAAFAADTLHIPAPFHHAFPASIETGAWLCAFEAYRRIRRGLDAGSLPRWMWTLAAIAAAINAAHGIEDAGPAAGLALGALSLLGVLLHSIRQGLAAEDASGQHGYRAVRLMRMLRFPRLAFAAASIRAARELDHATAWRLAWQDRYGIGPDSTRRDRQLGRVIVARESAEDRRAAREGELTIIGGQVQRRFAVAVHPAGAATERTPLPATATRTGAANPAPERAALNPATPALPKSGTADLREFGTGDEQRALSPRAAALLPDLRAAIERDELPPNPSVKRIRRYIRSVRRESLGVPAAQELRDATRELRLIEPSRREVV